MKFSQRQEEIIKLVKEGQPITSENLAEKLGVTRAALRADLAILTMTGTLDARPKVGYVYLGRKTNGDVLENLLKILSIYRISLGQARQEELINYLLEDSNEEKIKLISWF